MFGLYLLDCKFFFVFLAYLYQFNNFYQCILSKNPRGSNSKQTLDKGYLFQYWSEILREKILLNITVLNHFGIYKSLLYKSSWKNENKEKIFSTATKNCAYCWREGKIHNKGFGKVSNVCTKAHFSNFEVEWQTFPGNENVCHWFLNR